MTKEYSDYIKLLIKYRDELIVALSNEQEKCQALMDSDVERLEDMLQLQQAETMKLKSFEQKRLDLQEDLGYKGYKAKDIVAAVDDKEVQDKLDELFGQIADFADRIKQQNALAIKRANENLKMLDAIIQSDGDSYVYGPESGTSLTYSKEATFEKMV